MACQQRVNVSASLGLDPNTNYLDRDVTTDINRFSEEFRMGLSAPVFPALGNQYAIQCHLFESVWANNVIRSESAPVNSFPRNTSQDHADDVSWVFETSSSQWSVSSLSVAFCLVNDVWQCGSKYWIGEKAADQLTHHSGSYSLVVPDTNLRYAFARPSADCNH